MTEKQVNDLMAKHGLDKTRWHGYAYRAFWGCDKNHDYYRIHDLSIKEVAEAVNVYYCNGAKYAAIADALSTLAIAGLLERKKVGRKVYYSLSNDNYGT